MAISGEVFDRKCEEFTTIMRRVADWKHAYYGAAYSTRLAAAIVEAEAAIAEMKLILIADRGPDA